MNGTHWCRSPRPHFFLFFIFRRGRQFWEAQFFLERERVVPTETHPLKQWKRVLFCMRRTDTSKLGTQRQIERTTYSQRKQPSPSLLAGVWTVREMRICKGNVPQTLDACILTIPNVIISNRADCFPFWQHRFVPAEEHHR